MVASLFLDLASLALAVILVAMSVRNGFIREIFSFAALVGGFFISFFFYRDLQAVLAPLSSNGQAVAVTSFLSVYFVGYFAIIGAGLFLRNFAKDVMLGWLDNLLGGVLGLLKAAMIVWVACLSISSFNTPETQAKFEPSKVYGVFKKMPKFATLESLEKHKSNIRGKENIDKIEENDKKTIDNTIDI